MTAVWLSRGAGGGAIRAVRPLGRGRSGTKEGEQDTSGSGARAAAPGTLAPSGRLPTPPATAHASGIRGKGTPQSAVRCRHKASSTLLPAARFPAAAPFARQSRRPASALMFKGNALVATPAAFNTTHPRALHAAGSQPPCAHRQTQLQYQAAVTAQAAVPGGLWRRPPPGSHAPSHALARGAGAQPPAWFHRAQTASGCPSLVAAFVLGGSAPRGRLPAACGRSTCPRRPLRTLVGDRRALARALRHLHRVAAVRHPAACTSRGGRNRGGSPHGRE